MKTCLTCEAPFTGRGVQAYCKPACFPKCQTCGADGYYSTGYCRMHYRRVTETGDPGDIETRRPIRGKDCVVKGCARPHSARGLCTTHIYRLDNGLPLDDGVRQYERDGLCKVKGCEKKRFKSADFCDRHGSRVRRRGDPGDADRLRAPAGEAVWNGPEAKRARKLLDTYNLTVEQYDRMYAEQGGCCRSCGDDRHAAKSRAKSSRWMDVDHDHKCCPGAKSCGKCIRGLLCGPCNRGGGCFRDDPDRLERHARYIRETERFPIITD